VGENSVSATGRLQLPNLLRKRASEWGGPEGEAWLEALPVVVADLAERWGLRLGKPLAAHVSFVAPAGVGGRPAVLKIPMPGEFPYLSGNLRFSEHEALRCWDGNGTVRLLEHDPATGALLMEQCRPGTELVDAVTLDQADEIVAQLLTRLWAAPISEGLVTTDWFAECLEQRLEAAYERTAVVTGHSLLDEASAVLTELRSAPGEQKLLHGDLHHKNVLAAEREPWLVIDPLPRVGDPSYDAVQYLLFRKGSTPEPERTWNGDIDRFCGLVGLNADRVKRWLFVRIVDDACASLGMGMSPESLEAHQDDLWTARLVQRLL
jgi:streptomycin 6-kinase